MFFLILRTGAQDMQKLLTKQVQNIMQKGMQKHNIENLLDTSLIYGGFTSLHYSITGRINLFVCKLSAPPID